MDLSREYIKMCAEAREIQKKWIPKLGEFLWLGLKYICDESACRVLCDDPVRFGLYKSDEVWLPRRDQLQEMLAPENYFWYSVRLKSLNKKLRDTYRSRNFIGSGEQFWLCVVMLIKYGKVWNPVEEKWQNLQNLQELS